MRSEISLQADGPGQNSPIPVRDQTTHACIEGMMLRITPVLLSSSSVDDSFFKVLSILKAVVLMLNLNVIFALRNCADSKHAS